MRHKEKALLSEAIAALLILLFVYTAVSKLLELDVFRYVLTQSPLLQNYAALLAIGVPVIELLAAGLLLLPRTRRVGLWSSLLLLTGFTLYIGYMLLTQSQLPCSCGGVLRWLSWKSHLVFNGVFTGLAGAGLFLTPDNRPFAEGTTIR